jgi:hypothetical protein
VRPQSSLPQCPAHRTRPAGLRPGVEAPGCDLLWGACHQDAGLVKPVVGPLRATKDLVFHDLDGIRPGRKWRRQIEEALYAAHLVVLFWYYHTSRSREVRYRIDMLHN